MREALLTWYGVHRRDLPWRSTRDPYRIWVSEVMLQQTRVAAVLEHYRAFLEAFPTVQVLSAASEAEVLARWSGLGYYRRARMLHQAAQVIVREHQGVMPQTAEGLRALPGFGAYTAAAVGSIAYALPVAAVDGNVERVLARIAGWSAAERGFEAQVRGLAAELVDPQHPGDYNQALMELGATICLPRQPLCLHCPWQPWCRTRGEHTMPARRPMQRQHSDRAAYLRGEFGAQQVLLVERSPQASLMAGMWELPTYTPQPGEAAAFTVRHAITVTNHVIAIYTPRVTDTPDQAMAEGRWIHTEQLDQLALTGLTRKVLRRLGCMPQKKA